MAKAAAIKDSEIRQIITLAELGYDLAYIVERLGRSRKAVRMILERNNYYKSNCKHMNAKMVGQHILRNGRSKRKYHCPDCGKYFVTSEQITEYYQPTKDELFNMMRFK